MKTTLTIPKTINVGFQNRSDTYTGKLAYVVYTDAKGVLRKQASWDSWRDQKIEAQTFDNVPTSGFVLNKKVGDYSSSWGGRRAWIRIYDPRDFEFEISVENLLFILEETSAIKAKGLEGEFVYSWSGSDLVLLPTGSQDYKASSEFTELQTKKIGKSDMAEGCLYRSKDNQHVMYLGRLDWFELAHDYTHGGEKAVSHSKQHVFVSVDGKSTYWVQPGFTKLAERLSSEPSPLYAAEFEKYMKSHHGTKFKALLAKPASTPLGHGDTFLKKDGKYYHLTYSRGYDRSSYWSYGYNNRSQKFVYTCYIASDPTTLTENNKLFLSKVTRHNQPLELPEAEFVKGDYYDLFVETEEGSKIRL